MPKHLHEIRDPIHVFIRLNTDERKVVDSPPVQRLRQIHQLATTFLVYPGATHRRFEHSLGVMELAGRVFDVVTHPYNIHDDIRRIVPEITDQNQMGYWRGCLKMAALCHDIGHLPFSHAAEKELLPEGWDHERITRDLLASEGMRMLFMEMTPPLRADDVIKLAVGPKKARDISFSAWETVLAEIIVGDAFGVDRMDYLLRDSHHAGVVYGRFDHHRLIDTLRVLPSPPVSEQAPEASQAQPAVDQPEPEQQPPPREPALGVDEGGLHSAEALMLARFFMYSQLYFHPIRRAYDIHLKDFLIAWVDGGQFSTEIARHLEMTDNEVTAALLHASRTPDDPGHDAARRLTDREHFRVLYQRHPDDVRINPEVGKAVFDAACKQFGAERCRHDRYSQRSGAPDFPVLTKDGRIASSLAMSQTLTQLEAVSVDFVFVDPAILAEAKTWLQANREQIITPAEELNDE
jgi:uncharacterized protein